MTSRCQIEGFAVDLGRELNKVRRGENGASSACGGPCVGPVQASPVTSACTSDCLVEVRVMEWPVPLVGMIMVGLIAQAHALEVQLALYWAERVGAPAQCFPSG